jgi:hypothetical protein
VTTNSRPTTTKQNEIALESAVLDNYVGRYKAQGEGVFIVVREGGFLTIQLPDDWGLPKLRLRPSSPLVFFASELTLARHVSNRRRRPYERSPDPPVARAKGGAREENRLGQIIRSNEQSNAVLRDRHRPSRTKRVESTRLQPQVRRGS